MRKRLPLVITLLVLFAAVLAYLFIPKSYDIYQQAIGLAREDSTVRSILGENISAGLFAFSKVSHRMARFEIPVSGSSGTGTLLVYGNRKENEWVLDNVFFINDELPGRYVVFGD